MLGLAARLNLTPRISATSPSPPQPLFADSRTRLAFSSPIRKARLRLVALAEKEGESAKGGWRLPEGFRWSDLVASGDPENILAVGLTAVLTWASVQVLWQLVAISTAIVVAAVKYSFIAALLIFILITLL